MTTQREHHTEGDCMEMREIPTVLLEAFAKDLRRTPRLQPKDQGDAVDLLIELARRPFEPIAGSPMVNDKNWRVGPDV